MGYQYYNKFNLSKELAEVISEVISEKEKGDYVCKAIVVTIPEHKGLVFSSPLDGYKPWGGGLKALSGAQINDINEKYGKYVEGVIPEKDYSYLVVMENEAYEKFLKLSFLDQDEIDQALQSLGALYEEYAGIFDSRTLSDKFPYLQEFFDTLDEWRALTGRVTLDEEVLEEGMVKTLSISNV